MSLVLTRMQNLRSVADFDKNEYRMSRYGAHTLFQIQTGGPGSIVTPDLLQKALDSSGRVLEIPVIDYNAPANISNVRSITIADDENTSRMLQFTFVTVSFGFTVVPDLYRNNEIGAQQDFNTKMTKYLYQIAANQDSAALAALELAKTQVLLDDLGGKYSLTADTLKAPIELQDELIGDLNPIQHGNDFYGPMTIVAGNSLDSLVRNRLLEKGTFNTDDKTYQYNDKAFLFTNRLVNGVGVKATGFAVAGSQCGLLTRLERASMAGRVSSTGHVWSRTVLPIINMPCGTYYYESVGDFSGIAGAASADMVRVMKEHYGFAYDYAYVTAYNSDDATIPSPILKFEIDQAV